MPDRDGLVVLPASYRGAVPTWPLPDPNTAELERWAELWRLPQAVVWSQHQLGYQVAMHVRTVIESEAEGATKALKKVAHSQAVSLLLTPTSLRRAGYRVSPMEAI